MALTDIDAGGGQRTGSGRTPLGPVLALTSVSFFMVALDALVVVTALPAIHRSIGGSVATLEWAVNSYALTFAAGIITAAALGDRVGRRRVYVAGLALFTVASAACALAPTAGHADRGPGGAGHRLRGRHPAQPDHPDRRVPARAARRHHRDLGRHRRPGHCRRPAGRRRRRAGPGLALPTAATAALGAVPPADIGRASGVNNTLQRFGGAFGVAIVTAVFSAYGHLGSPASVVSGYRPALAVSAGLSLLGAVAAMAVGRNRSPATPDYPASVGLAVDRADAARANRHSSSRAPGSARSTGSFPPVPLPGTRREAHPPLSASWGFSGVVVPVSARTGGLGGAGPGV
jgi:MFS family permease